MTNLRTAAQQALEALTFYKGCYGASPAEEAIITALRAALSEPDGTSAQQSMQTVREGFGRTMSYLTEVFGVSRQTLYNWLSGEKSPSPEHEGKIHQLEVASQRFMELGFKPSPSQLTRTLAQGKSFLELLAAGGDGATNADKLVNLVQRGEHSRARLEALARTVMLNQTSHDTAQLPPQRPAEPVQEPVCAHGVGKTKCSFCSVEDKQPVQEPVAGRAFLERILAAIEGVIDIADRKTDEFDALRSCVIDLTLMLHTAPPQRNPLTEEEIWRTYKNLWMFHPAEEPRLAGDVLKFARAVERAHGIV